MGKISPSLGTPGVPSGPSGNFGTPAFNAQNHEVDDATSVMSGSDAADGTVVSDISRPNSVSTPAKGPR